LKSAAIQACFGDTLNQIVVVNDQDYQQIFQCPTPRLASSRIHHAELRDLFRSKCISNAYKVNLRKSAMTSVELRRTKWPLFRCFESAVLPSRLVRFHRVVDRHFVGVIALRAFKSPQFGMGRTWFNVRQHQATLTFGATWPLDRKPRWFGTNMRSRHVSAPCGSGGVAKFLGLIERHKGPIRVKERS
jgi:hypothetical protein